MTDVILVRRVGLYAVWTRCVVQHGRQHVHGGAGGAGRIMDMDSCHDMVHAMIHSFTVLILVQFGCSSVRLFPLLSSPYL
jgi:hypothetical protein